MTTYTLADLGTFNQFGSFGSNSSVLPWDINDSGLVVGTLCLGPGATMPSGFSYTQAGGIVPLAPKVVCFATGVNAAGQIAMWKDISDGKGLYQPALLAAGSTTPAGVPLPASFPPAYAAYEMAVSASPPNSSLNLGGGRINESGDFVGTLTISASPASSSPRKSVPLLISANQLTTLGNLGALHGQATAINAGGQIVGYSQPSAWDTQNNPSTRVGHAFLYTPGMGMVDLNSLITEADGTWELLWASDINTQGEIVGYGHFTPPSIGASGIRAFHFLNGVVGNLGALVSDGGTSMATAISDNGQIVGTATDAAGKNRACSFTGGVVDLNTRLSNPPYEWPLTVATAINNLGQIVGFGPKSGPPSGPHGVPTYIEVRGFLLTRDGTVET